MLPIQHAEQIFLPKKIREQKVLPTGRELNLLLGSLEEPASTAVWLVAVSCVRPEELAFKWKDLDAENGSCGSCAPLTRASSTLPGTTVRTVRFAWRRLT